MIHDCVPEHIVGSQKTLSWFSLSTYRSEDANQLPVLCNKSNYLCWATHPALFVFLFWELSVQFICPFYLVISGRCLIVWVLYKWFFLFVYEHRVCLWSLEWFTITQSFCLSFLGAGNKNVAHHTQLHYDIVNHEHSSLAMQIPQDHLLTPLHHLFSILMVPQICSLQVIESKQCLVRQQ